MYTPPAFRVDERSDIHRLIRATRLSNLVTATAEGLVATPLPLLLEADESENGVLYGHVARANKQWSLASIGEAMAIFMGPDAYITPSWYPTKQETGKVVPTWNYAAVHAYGLVEFFEDADQLLDVVTRLTNHHEGQRSAPWSVSDAPASFTASQLRGIVGFRMPITRFDAKRKMSQNRNEADRDGVIDGLAASQSATDRMVASLVPPGRTGNSKLDPS